MRIGKILARRRSFSSTYGSALRGALGMTAFALMSLFFVPIQMIYILIRPKDVFRFPQIFHRLLLRILGFHIRTHGTVTDQCPVLFVSNHSSYLDVPVLSSLIQASFVAKAEVEDWPLIGFLAKLQNTLFIERRSMRANTQRQYLHNKLAAGRNLILFPEGTSSDGLNVLPFKSSLFSIVGEKSQDHRMTVQPVSVTCTAMDGLPIMRAWRPYYAWFGDMTFAKHLWNVFKMGRFTVDVIFHPPVRADQFDNRKLLAAYCHDEVARGIELSLAGRFFGVGKTITKLVTPVKQAHQG